MPPTFCACRIRFDDGGVTFPMGEMIFAVCCIREIREKHCGRSQHQCSRSTDHHHTQQIRIARSLLETREPSAYSSHGIYAAAGMLDRVELMTDSLPGIVSLALLQCDCVRLVPPPFFLCATTPIANRSHWFILFCTHGRIRSISLI